ncbi:hypothetical protein Tco_0914522 [Tanacetum coccineum]
MLCILAFMNGRRHPDLDKKHIDKIPKTVDEMFKRVRAFIRGEVAARSAEVARAPQWDKGNVRTGWSRGQERIGGHKCNGNVNFPPPPSLIGTPKKQILNKFCDYHEDRGHNTNDYYHLKKQIKEAMASGKLSHLVEDIRQEINKT